MATLLRPTLLALAGFALCYSLPAKAQCYDLAAGQPQILSGRLEYIVYPGPPNYEDVQRGDTPEPNFVLVLSRPICVRGDDFADPNRRFSRVQVVPRQVTSGQLRQYLHQTVMLKLIDQMAAETGHHHEPLVAWVVAVTPFSKPLEFTDEYGTAATTIRTFYAALADGQGGPASKMVVPEKRGTRAFSPQELSRFYGSLRQPIQLLSISTASTNTYIARYRFATSTRTCNGRAEVRTVQRSGRYYIEGIRALDGC